MKKVFFCLALLLNVACGAWAQMQVRDTPEGMDSIGKPFHKQGWYNADPSYDGRKDRYDEALLRNDPEVLIANGKRVFTQSLNSMQPAPYQSAETVIALLDKQIKSMKYDDKSTTIAEAKSASKVVSDNSGNCLEVARFAFAALTREGYNAHIVALKKGGKGHAICVFQELDGSWSMFQAAAGKMGYFNVRAKDVRELITSQFGKVTHVKILI